MAAGASSSQRGPAARMRNQRAFYSETLFFQKLMLAFSMSLLYLKGRYLFMTLPPAL
jgi:hypothetical protein